MMLKKSQAARIVTNFLSCVCGDSHFNCNHNIKTGECVYCNCINFKSKEFNLVLELNLADIFEHETQIQFERYSPQWWQLFENYLNKKGAENANSMESIFETNGALFPGFRE